MPETLDALEPGDPAAIRSRRDLQRIHRVMGTRKILHRSLSATIARHSSTRPLRILEIGAGDGSLMLGVARALAPNRAGVELTLLDRQPLLASATRDSYGQVGWTVTEKVGDVMAWAAYASQGVKSAPEGGWDLILANLFLHHFESSQLALILKGIAARSGHFFACEPRRHWLALAGSHLVGAMGTNHVTREDAVLSVRAGFSGGELTALWPLHEEPWRLQEHSAGLFSHCFRAERAGLA